MSDLQIKSIIEALLFSCDRPVLIDQIRKVFPDLDPVEIRTILEELKAECENQLRGIKIVEVAGGFEMVTAPALVGFLKKFYKVQRKEKLSRPALETLAIVAYKQPVTKLQIQSIRGVEVDGVISNLKELGIIRIVGRRRAPGRPFLYGTTRQFLEYFGLRSLEDLPKIEDFPKMEESNGIEEATQQDRQN